MAWGFSMRQAAGSDATGRPRRTVQGKLLTLVLTSVAVAVALVAGVSAVRDSRREAALQTSRLQATAQTIGSLAADAVAAGDRTRAFAAIRAVTDMPDVRYARLEQVNGRLLVETGAAARLVRDARVGVGVGERGGFLSSLTSRSVEVSAPVTRAGIRVGTLVVLGRSEGVVDRLLSSLMTSALAAAVAVGAGLLAALRLQRSITRPIVALTRAMREVEGDHDYARTVDIAADDEIGELVSSFNRMLHEVSVRDARLAHYAAGLEQEVSDRTAELSVAKNVAEAANGAKSDFLATMSHEIRTPMNGIMVMAEMLAGGEMPPRQRRFAQVIAKSGASLLAIINDILDFSKIEAGKIELERLPVDLCDVVEDTAGLFWERARSKSLDLATFVDPAVPRLVLADPTRLRQVIGNLVNNALKFTETGGVLIEVEPESDHVLRISVRDTGIGIPQDKIPTVFGAFSQADQSTTRKFGGTGLGLSICKRLVEAMRGRFEVTSKVGRGSTFAFRLPIEVVEPARPLSGSACVGGAVAAVALPGLAARRSFGRYLASAGYSVATVEEGWPADAAVVVADPAALGSLPHSTAPAICLAEYGDSAPDALRSQGRAQAVLIQPLRRADLDALLAQLAAGEPLQDAAVAAPVAVTGALPQFTGAQVLVADDSAVNREVAVEALARLGIQARVVEDGRQAVEAVMAGGLDLVLMDGSMPELDGYDATREIRRLQAETGVAPISIVALTAHVVGRAAEAWREASMDAVLHKPFTLAGLAEALGAFLTPSGEAEAVIGPVLPTAKAASSLIDARVAAELAQMAAGGRADFVQRIRSLYRENAPAALARLVEAVQAEDAEEAASAAHALKSMSFNLGARAVADLSGAVENEGRDGRLPSPARLQALAEALVGTLEALRDDAQSPAPASSPAPVAAPTPDAEESALLRDLDRALQAGALTMLYQPQFDRNGGEVVGVEALIRWTDPVRGPIGPDVFIPLAEKFGRVRAITDWVTRRVIADSDRLDPFVVAFNVSADEFKAPDFPDRMLACFDRPGLDRRRFEIEVTETAILDNEDQVLANIARLHEAGFRIALDDFGTGYTSLRSLRRIPFDKLKIDREFVTDCMNDLQCASLVHAVVSVGRALGMRVIAEGVETEAQRRFLQNAGVHALQGYLLSRPIPLEAIQAFRPGRPEPVRAVG